MFVAKLVVREPRLEALLSTEDCTSTASIYYDPMFQLEDPQLSNSFVKSVYELHLLHTAYVDVRVGGAATNPANYTRTSGIKFRLMSNTME